MFSPRVETWRGATAALAFAVSIAAASAAEPEHVTFPGRGASPPTLQALLYRPANSATPRPAVIALHGCGGNTRSDGRGLVARVPDWTERFVAAGYVVLWPDSFGSRGLGPQCGVADRAITPALRAGDARAAAVWLTTQPGIDPKRIALIGWSNGGSTVLRAVMPDDASKSFTAAIAFYPGCRPLAEPTRGAPWSTGVPLTILMGGADDWTPPEPCRVLGTRANVRYVEYPGAFHDFDAPNAPVRIRKNLAFTATKSGEAHVGTDPTARAASIVEVMATLAAAFK